ncbi:transcriptional regulator [Rhodoplanes elegans]|uniref:Transcriptional regulator n=1 Tax=Rhodoplanes elegans TaxID=29408 RepID=A0A327K256_9BRAD|nr:helix-turn-helix transcriptional regulator [Rhodoplanes elegans]MBK5957619.1 transcriptional regulator [Rhodoplanes elegans]RAI31382.1 transcriptional regulator [Rhodoplanes elegans]
MSDHLAEIGRRLRAYRLGKNLTVSSIAEAIGVSRAAVYRLERGELVKIETLEKISELLETSLPSLMGVGVEYYANAVSFFERMRQLEETAVHVLGNFSPFSFLLQSDEYMEHLRVMLLEGIPESHREPAAARAEVEAVMAILHARRRGAATRRIPVLSIVSAPDIERFLRSGLVGRFDLPDAVVRARRALAACEIERFAGLLEHPPIGVQIGVIEDQAPFQTFQVFEAADHAAVTLSPYRLGDHPNITSGIAMATATPEAVRLFKTIITEQWGRARKGEAGARVLRAVLARAAGG